jgi:iron(III) transport system substrate-binding protein
VAILNTTQNPDAAKVFVDYVLSKDGQETLVELGSFIPVRPDVDPPEGAPSLDQINKLPTDWKAVQENRQATKDQWTAIFE